MAQDTNVENLIINKLTKAQYESIINPDPTQLYFITDEVISSADVISALGYIPYNATNPSGYISSASISSLTDVDLTGLADGQVLKYNFIAQKWENSTVGGGTWGSITGTLSDQTDLQNALDNKQNTISDLSTIRSGATLGATALQPNDNITELVNNAGYITSSALNGYATESFVTSQGYITGITNSDVTTALGYTPYNATNPDGFISGITSSDVTTALGYTPYNATNPEGFISSASVSSLTDVDLTSVANNQALLYNSTTQKWENKDVTITVDSALDSTSTNPVENRVIAQALEEISLAKNPNLNIIGGNLNIDSGNVSGFSTTDYMQFPFVFNFNGYTWTLEMGFTTGSDVTTQQNLIDSYYGIAFAIRNGKFVLAISSNGSSWDIANTEGTYSVQANTAYSVKIAWDGTNYTLSYALDETNYTTDITTASALVHHSTQEYVGGEPDLYGDSSQHPFAGTINLNNWKLIVNGLEVWLGMDDVGLGSRANIDLSNLTEAGQYMVDTVKDQNDGDRLKYWTGTKAEYDAIVTKDSTTLYNITDDTDTTLTLLELLFPVGAVYFGTMSTCPLQTLGVGTWQALPPDKVIQIAGLRGSVGDTLNESLPNHTHSGTTNTTGAHAHSGSTNDTGSHGHNIYQWSQNNTNYVAQIWNNSQGTSHGNAGSGAFHPSGHLTWSTSSFRTAGSGPFQGSGDMAGVTDSRGNHSHSFSTSSNGDHSHTMTTGGASSSTYQDNAPVQPDAYLLNGWRRIA